MEVQTTKLPESGCPPHHWHIRNVSTDQGIMERWACQRCSATRERLVSRRRVQSETPKRYVGGSDDGLLAFVGGSGERVA
jgi:hypothetical protein